MATPARAITALFVLVSVGGFFVALSTGADPADFKLAGSQPQGSGEGVPVEILHLFVPPQGAVPYGQACITCHDQGAAEPYLRWQGSMMAQAARDPLFYAQLDLANADAAIRPAVDGMSDMCLRCHSPVGWLEGRSADPTGLSFIEKDLYGVQCHFCHRMIDPQTPAAHPDFTNILFAHSAANLLPPTFGNGMYVVDSKQTRRGPYGSSELTYPDHLSQLVGSTLNWSAVGTGALDHPVFDSDFHRSSNLCGTCHDVSNPKDCRPGKGEKDVQDCFPIERTWSEWSESVYASRGEAGNCQSCHMSGPHNGIGFGKACEQGSEVAHLNDVHVHDLTGGNVWMPQAIVYMKNRYDACVALGAGCVGAELAFKQAVEGLYPPATGSPFAGVETAALTAGAERARRTLKRSATLEVEATSPNLALKLTNRTGHKLPTGYPEGRRMWMNVKFVNGTGSLLAESGEYHAPTATLYHDQDVDPATTHVAWDVTSYTDGTGTGTTVAGPSRPTKVWEGRVYWDKSDCTAGDPADCPADFHFVLNNQVKMDNRIPPEGWTVAGFDAKRASPVIPASYSGPGWQGGYVESGTPVHWDRFQYPVPAGTDRVRMTLYYQTASREYVEALEADNPNTLTAGGFNRGSLLRSVWEQTGRSTPVDLLSRVQAIVDTDGNQLSDGWEAEHGLGGAGCADDSFNGDPDTDGLSNWQEFQLDRHPTLVGDPCDPALPTAMPTRVPVDVVLVLDTSGSMNDPAPVTGTPKIQVLRESVRLFLETWKDHAHPDDKLGVVYFGDGAQLYGGSLLHDFQDHWQAILADVLARPPGGWTAMGAGLHSAMAPLKNPVTQELLFDPAHPRNRHVILFGNGMQNRSPMLVPDLEYPEYLVVRDQTSAENPEVTGGSNVTIGAGLYSGFPIAPHRLTVHTVGIGVVPASGGDGWHTLLQRLAAQQSGQHNFITDARQLEGAFLESLVQALRGNTVEYLFEEQVDLVDTKPVELTIPVDPLASKLSVVLSWDSVNQPAPDLELLRPDGSAEPLAPISRGAGSWRIVTRFLDARTGDPGEIGNWVLRLRHPRAGGQGPVDRPGVAAHGKLVPISLRVHALVDSHGLKYRFVVPGAPRIGVPLTLTAFATEHDAPLRWMDEVTVTVRRPGASVGELLAQSRHNATGGFDADALATPFQRRLLGAFTDPVFAAKLVPLVDRFQLVDDGSNGDTTAGDGRFARLLAAPTVPGHWSFHFRMRGHTLSGHAFVREETHSVVVRIGPLSSERSDVRRVQRAGGWVLTFTPRDGEGNLLGPGYGGQIVVRQPGGPAFPVTDHLDGSYSAAYPPGLDPTSPVRVVLEKDTVHDGPVTPQKGLGCWLWLLLVVVLVLVVIWLVRRL
ncbi:MAG TPA: choice-of-anchor X domain-containing protein [Thermoanaerobaculia bacterium]|nr:choice-of-anchor X domain-containing protein [Thermoanaerobaculia bacterium]